MDNYSRAVLTAVDRLARPLVLRDESVTVSFSGDLRAASVPQMRLHLLSLACEDGPEEIVVDLSGATWLDRDGVKPLIEAHRRQTFRNATLRLDGISAPAARFLRSQPRLAQILGDVQTVLWRGRPLENTELDPIDAEMQALRDEIISLRATLSTRGALSRSADPGDPGPDQDR